ELVFLDLVLRPERVGLDRQVVARAPAQGAGQGAAILRHFLYFGDETPGGVVRDAIAVQVAGVATGVVHRVPAERTRIREAVLGALHARGDRDGKVVRQVRDVATAAAIAHGAVVGQVFGALVVRGAGAQAES